MWLLGIIILWFRAWGMQGIMLDLGGMKDDGLRVKEWF